MILLGKYLLNPIICISLTHSLTIIASIGEKNDASAYVV